MKKISVKIFFVCILIAQNTFAQINPSGLNGSNTVFTAIPFLRINPDVRTGGMGEVVDLAAVLLVLGGDGAEQEALAAAGLPDQGAQTLQLDGEAQTLAGLVEAGVLV